MDHRLPVDGSAQLLADLVKALISITHCPHDDHSSVLIGAERGSLCSGCGAYLPEGGVTWVRRARVAWAVPLAVVVEAAYLRGAIELVVKK